MRSSFLLLLFIGTTQYLAAQNIISGHVYSNTDSLAIPFAHVYVKNAQGHMQHTVTDESGAFSFSDITEATTLTINFVGFQHHTQIVLPGNSYAVYLIETHSDEIIIYADRFGKREEEVISMTLLDNKTLVEQTSINSNLNEMLGKTVPGMAVSTESASTYGQGIRGRDMLVLIDGIPQSTPVRSSSRELRSIDVSAIEQIEIVRGTTALYGYGSTGGIVNMVTKRPLYNKDTLQFITSVSGNTALVFANNAYVKSGPMGGRAVQQISGQKKNFFFNVGGSVEHIGKYYDAQGDLIPLDPLGQGGMANTNNYNIQGKSGYHIDSVSSIEGSVNYYSSTQIPGYTAVSGEYGVKKAAAYTRGKYPDELGTATRSLNTTLRYRNDAFIKHTALNVLVYFQQSYSRFPYDPASAYFPPYNGNTSAQTFIESKKIGSRIDFKTKTPFIRDNSIQYGLDIISDNTTQQLTDGRVWVPPITQLNLAPFLQMQQTLGKLILRGGMRYETVNLIVSDFNTLATIVPAHFVEGGSLQYNQLLFNAGIRYNIVRWFSPFVSFGQGYATTEVGRELRQTSASKVTDLQPKAQLVNNFEFGWDSRIGKRMLFSAVAFYNTSKYGVTLIGSSFDVQRAPERLYGAEAEATYTLKKWIFQATASYVEGKVDYNNDGVYTDYLLGTRISPPKLTGRISYDVTPKFRVLVQGLYAGKRKRFENQTQSFGMGTVTDYALFDLIINYNIWKGNLSLGINNVLNTFYYPAISQFAATSLYYVAGRGRTASITYTIRY
jgi:iron complex outermembrane receptor protein